MFSDSASRLKFIAIGTVLVVFVVLIAMIANFGSSHQQRFSQVYLAINYNDSVLEAIEKFKAEERRTPGNIGELEDGGFLDRYSEAKEYWDFVIEDKERIVAFSNEKYTDGQGTEIILEIKTKEFSIYRDEMLIKSWKKDGE